MSIVNNYCKLITATFFGAVLSTFSASVMSASIPGIPEIPKIPAFLPTVAQVPASQPMPIDGTWLIPAIGKKIRIDSGRAYAVDGWLHLFVLDIQPGMVVIKNITPTGPGKYSGEDLPLMGTFSATVQADQSISVTVAAMLGPVNYKLIPVQINNMNWYRQEMQVAGLISSKNNQQPAQAYQLTPPSASYQQNIPAQNQQQERQVQPSEPDNRCENSEYDPVTDTVSCNQ